MVWLCSLRQHTDKTMSYCLVECLQTSHWLDCSGLGSPILKLNYPNPRGGHLLMFWVKTAFSCMTLSHRISCTNFMWHLMQSQYDAIHRRWKPQGRKHLSWSIPKRSDEYVDSELWDQTSILSQTLYLFFYLTCADASYTIISNFPSCGVLNSQHLVVICLTIQYVWLCFL